MRSLKGIIVDDERIVNGDDLAPSMDCNSYRGWIKRMRKESRLCKVIMKNRPINEGVIGTPLEARVEHGQWRIHCECGGVETVSPWDPVAFCFSCANEPNQFHLRPVTFPSDIMEVEAALIARFPEDRHWIPPETVLDLVAQNTVLRAKGRMRT